MLPPLFVTSRLPGILEGDSQSHSALALSSFPQFSRERYGLDSSADAALRHSYLAGSQPRGTDNSAWHVTGRLGAGVSNGGETQMCKSRGGIRGWIRPYVDAPLLQAVSSRGTLVERTCLPGLAATRADGMRKFARVMGLNEAVSSNIPGRADINGKGIVRVVWHGSTTRRARPWVTGAGDSRR
jgi:hypothetical protein